MSKIQESTDILYAVQVFEKGKWVTLPERHHSKSLARMVARAEKESRQCNVNFGRAERK